MGKPSRIGGYFFTAIGLYFGLINKLFAIAFLAASVALGVANSLSALILEEISFRRYQKFSDLAKLVFVAVIENLGYRQMVAFFRCLGLWDYLFNQGSWGRMEKKGIRKVAKVGKQPPIAP